MTAVNGTTAAKNGRGAYSTLVWHVSKWLVRNFCRLWFRVRFEGLDHVPATGPVLLVANHASYLDPPLVGIALPRVVRYLAQAGLARFGPLRWWLDAVGVTLIDRDAPSKEAMRIVVDFLRDGAVVCIFPEGTRSRDGAIAGFRSGVEFLARRGRAAVVPVGIEGAARAMPRGALLPRPFRIVVRYGEPWTAEQVLAEGGLAALRARVAELARAPLRQDARAASSPTHDLDGEGAAAASPPPSSPSSPSSPTSTHRQPPGVADDRAAGGGA